MARILVTGGCGFIGSNFIRYYLGKHPDDSVVNVDVLTYAGNPENLGDLSGLPSYRFERADICDREAMEQVFSDSGFDAIVNFAAESHVDRSIAGAGVFVRTNVVGTQVLLDLAKQKSIKRFVQISTDEVYGSLGQEGKFTEVTPLHPNSPYAASKASADLLALSYHHTFGLPVVITRCSNNYGPFQFPEKLIPLMIANALGDKPLPVYGDGQQIRDWLFVDDHCAAIDLVMHNGRPGNAYNIGGNSEIRNIDLVTTLVKRLGKPERLISFVKDRPGHDRRYAIDASKIMNELGWQPLVRFEEGLGRTIEWYLAHTGWWQRILSGEYQNYYREMYEQR